IDFHNDHDSVATFVSVRPQFSFHLVDHAQGGQVKRIETISESDVWMNGGFFVLKQEIFDYMHAGEDLILEPFDRLIQEGRLFTMRHEGYWGCMDTFKEKQALDDLVAQGDAPWELWNNARATRLSVGVSV
ncbi:MAG: glucose-1-phosphate cytidylyltransferase, partial [Phycisphaeraceae bacterium]